MSGLPKLDYFLGLIEDGAWHSLQELSEHINIVQPKLVSLANLLSQIDMVEYEPQGERIRIRKDWQRLLKHRDEDQASERVAVGTVVLPPMKNVEIQGIQLTNLTEKELEVNVRLTKNLEFAIDMIQ